MAKIILPILLALVAGTLASQAAFAYSQTSLEKQLTSNQQLGQKAVEMASKNPGTGSGTPYFAADGVLGASAIAASIFGGIAGIFFLRGRHGRYVVQGRG